VPVGADQAQHIELARGVADAFNKAHGLGADARARLPLPRALALAPAGAARVMSLRDGRAKMSKSAPSDASRINLTDGDDAIAAKVRAAKTDSRAGVWAYDPAAAPEKANLLAVLAALAGETTDALAQRYAGAPAQAFKEDLIEALVATVAPLRTRVAALMAEPAHIDAVLRAGAAAARARADDTMRAVRDATGLDGGIRDAGEEER
jgi:tryptophanyl-tRNA synthetase